MKVELSFVFDVSDERINGPETPMQILGVSAERANQLLTAQSKMEKRDFATGVKEGNVVEQFARFLASENLSAHEVAFLCFTGFVSLANTKWAIKEFLDDPVSFLTGLGEL